MSSPSDPPRSFWELCCERAGAERGPGAVWAAVPVRQEAWTEQRGRSVLRRPWLGGREGIEEDTAGYGRRSRGPRRGAQSRARGPLHPRGDADHGPTVHMVDAAPAWPRGRSAFAGWLVGEGTDTRNGTGHPAGWGPRGPGAHLPPRSPPQATWRQRLRLLTLHAGGHRKAHVGVGDPWTPHRVCDPTDIPPCVCVTLWTPQPTFPPLCLPSVALSTEASGWVCRLTHEGCRT